MEFENLSRRSFIKRTSVLEVGIAAPVLLTGLANASPGYYEMCSCGQQYYIYNLGWSSKYDYGECFRPMVCNPDTVYEDVPNEQKFMMGTRWECYSGDNCSETLPLWMITIPTESCEATDPSDWPY